MEDLNPVIEGPRPTKLQTQAILLAQTKMLDTRSLVHTRVHVQGMMWR